jgi:hypothetical protein
MFALRRHTLLARLLGQLQQQVHDAHGSSSVLIMREVWEVVARRETQAYAPLLLYRMVGGFSEQTLNDSCAWRDNPAYATVAVQDGGWRL